ncbi:hypothetical protein AAC387_Pa07g2202 [Persea americana]
MELKVGEGDGDEMPEVKVGGQGDEVESDVFSIGGLVEQGKDGSHGAAQVGGVEGHGNVDCGGGADGSGRRDGRAVWRIVEFGSLLKVWGCIGFMKEDEHEDEGEGVHPTSLGHCYGG